jgi:hypothetical protein
VLAQLDAALLRAGHTSVVVACADSSPAGTLVATPRPSGPITDAIRRRAHGAHQRAIECALRCWRIDVVHMYGIDFHEYLHGLFEEGVGVIVAEAMLRHLTEHHDWRRCELHPLRAGAPLLAARVPPGLDVEILTFQPCLVV